MFRIISLEPVLKTVTNKMFLTSSWLHTRRTEQLSTILSDTKHCAP